MDVLLVHNPNSGDDDHARERLVELLGHNGHQVTYAHAKGGWRALLEQGTELIAVAGGDGTVSEVARATAHRGIPIAILPTGTANNIAGFLGLTEMTHADLIGNWKNSRHVPFDLGVVEGPWGTYEFLESVGVGLLAELMAEIDAGTSGYVNELDGRVARVEAALDVLEHMLSRSRPVACEVRLDDEVMSGDYLLLEILNFGSAGPNLRLSPHADAADGRLDVVLVRAGERRLFEAHVRDMRQDRQRPAALEMHHAQRVTVRSEGRLRVHLDDRVWTGSSETSGVTAEAFVRPAALTFVIPADGVAMPRSITER
jgi:diacylglycerol kinase (ATP)